MPSINELFERQLNARSFEAATWGQPILVMTAQDIPPDEQTTRRATFRRAWAGHGIRQLVEEFDEGVEGGVKTYALVQPFAQADLAVHVDLPRSDGDTSSRTSGPGRIELPIRPITDPTWVDEAVVHFVQPTTPTWDERRLAVGGSAAVLEVFDTLDLHQSEPGFRPTQKLATRVMSKLFE